MPLIFSSCIKDDPKNSECDILSAWVEGEEYEEYFFQTSQMRIDNILSDVTDIVFYIRPGVTLSTMAVYFTISDGATISPANGSLQDFSGGPVSYTVTSENGEWSRTYLVSFQEMDMSVSMYSFENIDSVYNQNSDCTYHIFFEQDASGQRNNIWASGNAAITMANQHLSPEEFPTYSVSDGYQGRGVCLNTKYAGSLGAMMGKPIAAGNLFIGSFNVSAVLTNALKATLFGIPTNRQPIRVTGYYKYIPGETFTNSSMEEIPGRVDEAHIYAVFYRNQDANGNSIILDGTNIMTSEYIVSRAQVASLPPTDQWSQFEMTFEGGTADPAILSSMGYSFTLVFTSSKNGDTFEGAIGSTLYIDEVEISF